MKNGTNAHSKPQFEGQVVKFVSPHHQSVILYDICKRNKKYGNLEWYALNNPTDKQTESAFWID
jgi:hypothetical protein